MVIRGLSNAGYGENVSTILYGNYSTLSVPMFSLVVALLTPLAASMLPILTKSYSIGNNEDFSRRLSEFTNAIALIFVPAFFVFLFFSKECLTLLFEEGSAVLGAPMLTVLSPSVIFFALLLLLNTTLEARGEIKIPVISLTVGAIIKGIVGVTLLERTDLGIFSAPIGTTVSYASSFLISYFYVSKKSSIKIKNKSVVMVVLLISGLCSVISLIVKKHLNFYLVSRVKSVLILSIYALTYLLLILFFCFKRLNFQEKIGILHKKRQ
jgi:stage V sporulation protein B